MNLDEYLRSISNLSDDAIFREDMDGTIISWNDGAKKMYGYTKEEIIGKSADVLFAYPLNDKDLQLPAYILKGRTIKNRESSHKRKDGKVIPVSISKGPLMDQNDRIIGIINIIKYHSGSINTKDELRSAKEAVERESGTRAAFLADISHEMRTPLNAIIGFTGMLLDSVQDENDKKLIKTIHKSGKRLLHLINDLIDFSRIEAGKIKVNMDVLDLELFMNNIKDQFQGYNVEDINKDIDFILDYSEELKEKRIVSDEQRLHQVLANLLDNAFKFTDRGKIEFGVEKKGEYLLFFVKDSGQGIKKKDQQIIFNRYKRLKDSNRDLPGNGLGLSISSGLVELLGGEMWVESEPAKGSLFNFTIPYEEANGDNVQMNSFEDQKKDMIPDLKGRKILIAEDDPYSLEMISFLVKSTGAEIVVAEDGEKASELFHQEQFDLALLDLRLPGKTGYELVKEIKNLNPDFPVVAQSAYALSDDTRTYKEKGFDAYITKPIKPEILYAALRKYLD